MLSEEPGCSRKKVYQLVLQYAFLKYIHPIYSDVTINIRPFDIKPIHLTLRGQTDREIKK
jgi:hypothetical protein